MHAEFETLLPHAKRAGAIATSLAAVIAGSFGWSIGGGIIEKTCFAVGLALASFIVGYALVFAYHAWQRGMYGVAVASIALFGVAVAVEFMSHIGFTASHRTANVQQATLQTTAYTDQRQVIADLERDVKRLEAKHDWQKSMDAPESYDAKLAAMEGDLIWKRTKECTDATLPDSREFCARYGTLKAERAIAHDRMVVAEEIKLAKQNLADARAKSSATQVGHSTVENQGLVLATLISGDLKPDESTQKWAGIGISALLAVFWIAAGLLNLIAYSFNVSVKQLVTGSVRAVAPSLADVAIAPRASSVPAVPRPERVVERIVEKPHITVQGTSLLDAHLGQLGWVNRAGAAVVAA